MEDIENVDEFIESETDEMEDKSTEDDVVSFEDLGLDERTLASVRKKGFEVPSPIQVLAIPRLLNGEANIIARARTGTGKTAAFGLPLVQKISGKSDFPEALILEPTRELAMQTCSEMQSFTDGGYPRTCVLYGGASYVGQIKDLKRGSEIVVGTPGRIQDHLERGTLDISKIKYFILDEGDEMLDMGFIDDIEHIFEQANPDARILLFSATIPAPILKIAQKFMGEYEIIEEEKVVDEPLLIDQKFWVVRESEKIEALVRLIDMSPDFYGLVFTMTKNDADNVTRMLDLRGYEAAALHGDIMQNQREKVLERFRSKKTRILVATDVAARGIDISGLSHVVNYSLPFDGATYVHRIGRTGRAGQAGNAITFVRPEERRKLGFLQRAISKASKGEMIEETVPSVHDVLEAKRNRIVDDLSINLYGKTLAQLRSNAEENSEGEAESENNLILVKDVDPFFSEMAEKLTSETNSKEVLANVLSFIYGEKLSPKHYGKVSVEQKKSSGQSDPDSTRIFVSLGKRDGMSPRDIAEFFSDLLNIPGRKVDKIDMSREFSLVSLPKESAKRALEMAEKDRRLPHMHVDSKPENDGGSRRSRSRGRDFGKSERDFSHARGERERDSRRGERSKKVSDRRESRSKGSRPNFHTQSERNAASMYKKGGGKKERF